MLQPTTISSSRNLFSQHETAEDQESPPMASPSPPQLSCSELSGPSASNQELLDLEPDNHKQHQHYRTSLQPGHLEEPQNPDDSNSGRAGLPPTVPTVAFSSQLSNDQDDPHQLPPPAPPSRKWYHPDEYYDALIQAQREHMLSLGWDWENDADCKAYKTYRRSVRRLESLPWYHLEKISLYVSFGKESAKVWAQDVSDDVAIQTARTKAWAKDLWNDLVNASWPKNMSDSRKRRKAAEEVRRQEMENPRCWCRDCVPGRPLPQFMLPRAC
ncbi:Protein of unknown function [Pyronema omphalodes CBS 100304]|uniref:Uncharacterized protein n=1 Tax=Pyronema omphalodes (strain CBS 100304) TaxID=1076935 RepID=U4LPN1_PYROM|nr:Protein of unknown function [Pyronema omphalodes CBS 100304]